MTCVCAVFGTGLHRRSLGNNFDQRLKMYHSSFLTTADNRFILAAAFWDKSFRVFSTDSGMPACKKNRPDFVYTRPVKISVLFLIRKKYQKGGGREVWSFFFNTERMTLDCACDERAEKLYKNTAGIS